MTAQEQLLPPNNLEAEEAVLGSILKLPSSIAQIAAWLTAEDFFLPRHKHVFRAMLELHADGVAVDFTTVGDRLQQLGLYEASGGLLYLSELNLTTPTAAFIEDYARIVKRTAMKRQLIANAQMIAERAYRDGALDDIDDVLEAAEAAIRSVRTVHPDRGDPSAAFDFVVVADWPEPGPRVFRVDPLVPDGAVTLLYGDAGLGKSILALGLGVSVAAGLATFAGMPVRGGRVLYIDAELDADEFARRAHRVARGFGLASPPRDLVYLSLAASLSTSRGREWVTRAVQVSGADFVLLDSLTFASAGAKLNDPGEMTAVLMGLRGAGTLLCLDHSNWEGVSGNQSESHPMGSFMKRAFARSMVQIDRALGGGITLRSNKSNFRELPEPIHLAVAQTDERVVIQRIDVTDGRMAGAQRNMPATERIRMHLLVEGPATPDRIAEAIGLSIGYVKNLLTALRIQRRAEPLGDGRWHYLKQTDEQPPNGSHIASHTESHASVAELAVQAPEIPNHKSHPLSDVTCDSAQNTPATPLAAESQEPSHAVIASVIDRLLREHGTRADRLLEGADVDVDDHQLIELEGLVNTASAAGDVPSLEAALARREERLRQLANGKEDARAQT